MSGRSVQSSCSPRQRAASEFVVLSSRIWPPGTFGANWRHFELLQWESGYFLASCKGKCTTHTIHTYLPHTSYHAHIHTTHTPTHNNTHTHLYHTHTHTHHRHHQKSLKTHIQSILYEFKAECDSLGENSRDTEEAPLRNPKHAEFI